MIYTIKIENAQEESGQILFDRLISLASSMKKISEGALQLRLWGVSKRKGRKPIDLGEALVMKLIALKNQSTGLDIECRTFQESLSGYQVDMFEESLQEHTPVSMVMESFKIAFSQGNEDAGIFMDKALLKELKSFKTSLLSNEESILISNQGSREDLLLTTEMIDRIQILEDEIPPPKRIIITGLLEELKFSKYKVKLQTNEGLLDAFITPGIDPDSVSPFWGKEVTASGTLHFGINNTKSLEIERLFTEEEVTSIDMFKSIPKSEMALKDSKKDNPLERWEGKWPSDEDYEDLRDSLNE